MDEISLNLSKKAKVIQRIKLDDPDVSRILNKYEKNYYNMDDEDS